MNVINFVHRVATALLCLACLSGVALDSHVVAQTTANPVPVKLVQESGNWQLQRDGQPYYVKGAGGGGSLKLLAAAGANSNRSWGVKKETRARLDEAHENGLTMAVGIWLAHERHGFDYSDEDALKKQTDKTIAHVKSLKDHPAVLVWGIGNEMEGSGDNAAIFQHIEKLAALVKKEDPNHPVMTVIAGARGRKVEMLHKHCPSIDIVGINAYGEAKSVPQEYRKLGGTKPYIMTEFGPTGTWQCPKNSLGAVIELTSGQKAEEYKASSAEFAKDTELCLGSYAFTWGHKQEGTATWFGMLLPDGKRTAAVDTMTEIWSGKPPANRCPVIEEFKLISPLNVTGGNQVRVNLVASDPEGDSLNVRWAVTGEAESYSTGGDKQWAPPEYKEAIVKSDLKGAIIKVPNISGTVRIYAYVDDGDQGGAATASLTIGATARGKKVQLPMVVLNQTGESAFAASGYMGSIDSLKLDDTCEDQPHSGEHCTRVTFDRNDDWGGVVWQHPANDWGDKPGGFDLTGAKELSFWARGSSGGERITFGMGVIGDDKPFSDTCKNERQFLLTEKWKEYSIDLEGEDLQRIKSGFFFSLTSQGKPVEFFLDSVEYK